MPHTIALFTGSFNPPTLAHRQVLQRVRQELPTVPVVVIPAARTIHKDPSTLAPFANRMAMVSMMVAGLDDVSVSEVATHVPSAETVALVAAVRAQYNSAHIILVMGADVFATLPQWQDWQVLTADNSFYVLARHPGAIDGVVMPTPLVTQASDLATQPCWYADKSFVADASASAVRAGDGHDYLADDVRDYIAQHGLYL